MGGEGWGKETFGEGGDGVCRAVHSVQTDAAVEPGADVGGIRLQDHVKVVKRLFVVLGQRVAAARGDECVCAGSFLLQLGWGRRGPKGSPEPAAVKVLGLRGLQHDGLCKVWAADRGVMPHRGVGVNREQEACSVQGSEREEKRRGEGGTENILPRDTKRRERMMWSSCLFLNHFFFCPSHQLLQHASALLSF